MLLKKKKKKVSTSSYILSLSPAQLISKYVP